MALSCHDTAHGATCVFVFVQWNIIAMQIREEWLPKHLMFSRIQWVGISNKDRFFHMNRICWRESKYFIILISSQVFPIGNIILKCKVIKAIRSEVIEFFSAALGFVRCVYSWGSGVVCPVPVLYWT